MQALTHVPSPCMQDCQRTYVPHDEIDISVAREQHAAYCRSLEELGLTVRTLDVNQEFPDAAFVEDTAIVLDEVAIVASMGSAARVGETAGVAKALAEARELRRLTGSGTIEGGDVLRIGRTLLVGLSARTNRAGVEGFAEVVQCYGYRVMGGPG